MSFDYRSSSRPDAGVHRWSWAVVPLWIAGSLLFVVAVLVGLYAIAAAWWGPFQGDELRQCLLRPGAPSVDSDTAYVKFSFSGWPLGVDCHILNIDSGASIATLPETSWSETIVAYGAAAVAILLVIVGIIQIMKMNARRAVPRDGEFP